MAASRPSKDFELVQLSVDAVLRRGARQGKLESGAFGVYKHRVRVRFPSSFFRGVMLVPEWSRFDALSGERRA